MINADKDDRLVGELLTHFLNCRKAGGAVGAGVGPKANQHKLTFEVFWVGFILDVGFVQLSRMLMNTNKYQ